MLGKLSEEDFAALRGPFESGRQSPDSLGATLILSILIQGLFFSLEYFVAGDVTVYPNKEKILIVHFWITIMIGVLSLVYALPVVYRRSQRIQYLLVILVSQNLGAACAYIMALFLSFEKSIGLDRTSAKTFTYVTLLLGLLVFLATSIRFYILLHKGHYRKGSKKDRLRSGVEAQIKSYLPTIIAASVGLLFILQFLFRSIGFADVETIIMITLFLLIFYTMLFVLPEQLVLLYCKYRFESFNFYLNGMLKPMENTKQKDVGL